MSLKKKTLKKAISTLTAITTVVWLSGVSMLAVSSVAVAAVPSVTVEGVTVNDGDLISSNATNSDGTPTLASLDIYIAKVVGTKKFKRLILNPAVFNSYGHLSWGAVREVNQSVMDAFSTSALVRVDMTMDPSGKVYAMAPSGDTGMKGWVNLTAAQFTGVAGTDVDSIYTINSVDAGNYTTVGDVTTTTQLSTFYSTGALPSTTPIPTGELIVALSANTPPSVTVPYNAQGLEMLKLNVSGTGKVTGLNVQRYGAGAATDFSSVYLYDGATRLTTGRTVNSTTHMVNFTGLNLSVNGTKTLSVVADLSGTGAGNVDGFKVNSASDVTADITVTGTFPVTGNVISRSAAAVGTVTIERTGSLVNPKLGETQIKVAEFRLTAGAAEDISVQRVALFQGGNISRSNLSNFTLKQAGATVATVASLTDKDLIVLSFTTPYTLLKGDQKIFELFANVAATSKINDTIRIYVEESSDVSATGKTYGYGVSVTRTAYDNGSADGTDASWTTVEGGQITNVFQGPAAKDVATNSKDIEAFRFTMTSQNNVEVRRVVVNLTAVNGDAGADVDDLIDSTATVANYSDIKIVDVSTGAVVSGPLELSTGGSDTTQDITYTDIFNVNAGQTRTFMVTLDVRNNTDATFNGDTFRVTLNQFGASDIKNLDNNAFVQQTDIVPNSAITGNTHTVRSAGLTVSRSSTPTSQTFIRGSVNVPSLGINLQAGTGGAVRVRAISVTGYIDATTDEFTQGTNIDGGETDTVTEDVLQGKLWDGAVGTGTQVGTTKSPSTSTAEGNGGLFQFTGLNVLIPAGTTKTLTFAVDLASAPDTLNDRVKFDVAADTNITAEDPEGNSITPVDADGGAWGGINSLATDAGVRVTVADAGTLSYVIAPDDSDSEIGLVVAGTTGVTLAKYRFTAQNEELKITKAQLTLATAANSSSILNVRLYDGATPVSSAVNMATGGTAIFNDVNFIVPKDSSKTLTAKADLNTISAGAVSSNNLAVIFGDGTGETFEARGTNSSTVLATVTGGDVQGRDKILRKTKITVDRVATSNSLVNGSEQDIYSFKVTADSAEDAALRQLKFSVDLVDNSTDQALTVSNWKIFRGSTNISGQALIQKADGTLIEAASFVEADEVAGADVVVTFGSTGLNGEEVIPKGTSVTYTLRGTPTNYTLGAEDDGISIELLSDTTAQTAGNTYIDDTDATAAEVVIALSNGTTTNEAANIIWSDNSAVPHTPTVTDNGSNPDVSSADFINGYLLKNMPIGASSMNI